MKKNIVISLPGYMILLRDLYMNGKSSLVQIQERVKLEYCHIHNLKIKLSNIGWIYISVDNRKHILSLTEKGNTIATIIDSLFKEMNITDESMREFNNEVKEKETNEVIKNEIDKKSIF